MTPDCPLCHHLNSHRYFQDKHRDYWQCINCQLVFVDPGQRLSNSAEKAQYDLHKNSAYDREYRQFLSRLYQPLGSRISNGDSGLDFGCGPGPALSTMFEEAGFIMKVYDVFYADDKTVLEQYYHFISATEVVEHLFEPGKVLRQLWQQLLPGGTLGLMTKLVINAQAFASWHYKNDPTHVCFFSRQTFNWLAQELDAELEIIGQDVILLIKRY